MGKKRRERGGKNVSVFQRGCANAAVRWAFHHGQYPCQGPGSIKGQQIVCIILPPICTIFHRPPTGFCLEDTLDQGANLHPQSWFQLHNGTVLCLQLPLISMGTHICTSFLAGLSETSARGLVKSASSKAGPPIKALMAAGVATGRSLWSWCWQMVWGRGGGPPGPLTTPRPAAGPALFPHPPAHQLAWPRQLVAFMPNQSYISK